MQKGDTLKITEDIPHGKENKVKSTIGIIEYMSSKTITIRRLCQGSYLTSYGIADFRDIHKHYYISKNGSWQPIKIKVTQRSIEESGGKYA